MRTKVEETREAEHDRTAELSDEELEHVVGGLNRVWTQFTPFMNTDTGVAPPAPRQNSGGVVDTLGRDP